MRVGRLGRAAGIVAAAAALLADVALGSLGTACVDGVTPDCSDAAAQCGPAEAFDDARASSPEAGADADGDGAVHDAADAADGG